jgi:hypothetical protein
MAVALYSDAPPGPIRERRVVICIDSLWRVSLESFDLLVLDVFAELRRALPKIQRKHAAGGHWNVWLKLGRIARQAGNVLALGAHSDAPEKRLLERLGLKAHWQINKISLLTHLRYTLLFSDFQHALVDIASQVQICVRLVLPCAENTTCLRIAEILQERCPGKSIACIHGSMDPGRRAEFNSCFGAARHARRDHANVASWAT